MKKLILAVLVFGVVAVPAIAQQLAPTPRAAPRTPVNREALAERRAAVARDISGQALVLDGDKLRIGDIDLRLFGIVPPQLSASFGPQARAELDAVMTGQTIACHIRDRDHDGRLLATCQTAKGIDPALNLLQHGLAVAARGSIADTELLQPYIAAEMAAQSAKLGLWSVAVPDAAMSAETPKVEAAKVEAPKAEPVAVKTADVQAKTASALIVPVAKAVAPVAVVKDEPKVEEAGPGFFARYQMLIAVLLMLVTAVTILGVLSVQRRLEKREEMKALAAALRGELLAARAVCQTRIKSIVTAEDDRLSSWPRIRSTLYQAYVSKLGWLGAELARQVASIYGQASDYAAYYNSLGDSDAVVTTPKKQALQALVAHIEEVLPRLAGIEVSGDKDGPQGYVTAPAPMPAVPDSAPPPPALTRRLPQPVSESVSQSVRSVMAETVTHAAPSTAPVATTAEPQATPPVPVPPSAPASLDDKLRSVVRNLRDRFVDHLPSASFEEPLGDYTTLIEEDIERFSFGEDDDHETTPLGRFGRH